MGFFQCLNPTEQLAYKIFHEIVVQATKYLA
jgi:hypothetical protein